MKQTVSKERAISSAIFAVAIAVFVAFLSSITLAYFYDTGSVATQFYAASVNISQSSITFPTLIEVNSTYDIDDYPDLAYNVTNVNSTAGPVFVMVKITGDLVDYIRPISSKWYQGKEPNAENTIYYYYSTVLLAGDTTEDIADYWYIGNIPRATMTDASGNVKGSALQLNFTAYAVQAVGVSGGAPVAMALINDNTNADGWQYAPEVFRTYVRSYTA